MQEKLAALWIKFQEQLRPYCAEIKEHGLSGLRKVIRGQASMLCTKAQEMVAAAWQWVTAKVKAVPASTQTLLPGAVALAVVVPVARL